MRIYIANLGKYNEGILKGAWLELPFTETEKEEAFIEAGLGYYDEDGDYVHGLIEVDGGYEYHYEEFAIHDHEYCPFDVEEYSDLEKLNEWAELAEGLDEDALEIVEAVIQYMSEDFETVVDWYNDGEIQVYHGCKDMSDVAYEIVNECYTLEGPLASYFDYERFGRDLDIEGTYIQVKYDMIVEVRN